MAFYPCMGEIAGENLSIVAPHYSTAVTYNKEDVVIYNSLIYMCNTDGVSGAWNSTYWDKVYLADLTDYNSNLNNIDLDILWTNTQSSTELAQKTLSIDLSEYSAIFVEWQLSKTDSTLHSYEYILVGGTGGIGARNPNTNSNAIGRQINVTTSSIFWSTCRNGVDAWDSHCWILKIYGVKKGIVFPT